MASINWQDMAQEEERSREPAPAGRYVLRVDGANWGQSKEKKVMWTVRLKIDEGPQKGKAIWRYLTFEGNALSMSRGFLNALGIDFKDLDGKSEQEQSDMLIGRRCEAELMIDHFQGQARNKMKGNPVRGLTPATGSSEPQFAPPPLAGGADKPTPTNPLDGL